jgi:multisubunit Na+/H+ antiporter MnhB subunit
VEKGKEMNAGVLDIFLSVALLWLAYEVCSNNDTFRSVIMYIAFGIVMSVTWLRLGTLDIALVEAAVGAGVMGILLVEGVSYFKAKKIYVLDRDLYLYMDIYDIVSKRDIVLKKRVSYFLFFVAIVFTVYSTVAGGKHTPLAQYLIDTKLFETGVDSKITAVLLNFRGYDTLLETTVMMIALTGGYILSRSKEHKYFLTEDANPIFIHYVQIVFPLGFVFAIYIFYAGEYGSGGAFQSASIMCGVFVLLFYANRFKRYYHTIFVVCSVIGLLIFIILGVLAIFVNNVFMKFILTFGKLSVMTIEFFLMISIATIMINFFFLMLEDKDDT